MSAAKKKKNIGELLVQKNIIPKSQLLEIEKSSYGKNKNVLSILIESGHVSEKEMVSFLSEQYNYQVVDLDSFDISKETTKLIPQKFCEKFNIIPVSRLGDVLVLAISNPLNIQVIKDQLLFTTGCKAEFVLSTASAIQNAISQNYDDAQEDVHKLYSEIEASAARFQKNIEKQDVKDDDDNVGVIYLDTKDSEPAIRFVNRVISSAHNKGASDIHIETYEKSCRIRFRIDGKLHEMFHPQKAISNYIISRMKIMSKLDIGERRKPQDGRMKVKFKNGKEISFRVSTTPTIAGEKIVMRVLDDTAVSYGLGELGMSEKESELFVGNLNCPQGMVLITGPTGSGKTTTIYTGLQILNTKDRNISTAEDPIEYNIEGLNQVQMNSKIGLTFSSTLRAFLRQDPDVILIGEIRDYETAEIAFKAAATGHLVVSTLHTNDTPSSVTRLLDIGIPDYSISENVSLVVGQRLLRKLCPKCQVVDNQVSRESLKVLEVKDEDIEKCLGKIKTAKGCRYCSNIGYKGRVAVYEMLQITDTVKRGIFNKMSALDLKHAAMESGELVTLRQSGIQKMINGTTSFEEVMYSTQGDFR